MGIGAWAERQGIDIALEAAADEGIVDEAPGSDGAPGGDRAPGWGRVAVIRLLSLVPVLVVVLLAWRPVYDVTYRELTLPDDLVTPLPLRVLTRLPLLVAASGSPGC